MVLSGQVKMTGKDFVSPDHKHSWRGKEEGGGGVDITLIFVSCIGDTLAWCTLT